MWHFKVAGKQGVRQVCWRRGSTATLDSKEHTRDVCTHGVFNSCVLGRQTGGIVLQHDFIFMCQAMSSPFERACDRQASLSAPDPVPLSRHDVVIVIFRIH